MIHTFGPVPSRRLGRSLGVNNIPPQYCSYACVYCQLGDPQRVSTNRREFYRPDEVVSSVRDRIAEHERAGGAPLDYITVVPDGEPTLDLGLMELMAGLRELVNSAHGSEPATEAPVPGSASPRIAVISNGSLLSDPAVRRALALADWVSVKMDAADTATWRRIDRPARDLDYEELLSGIAIFASEFTGILATETMLVSGLNDADTQVSALAARIAGLPRQGGMRPESRPGGGTGGPDVAYLSIPTRPPAVGWVAPPSEERILAAYYIYRESGIAVELNTGYEVGEFSTGDDVSGGILAIAAVHPIGRADLENLVESSGRKWCVVEDLLADGQLIEKTYRGRVFYVTRLRRI